jgi:hypothetical protein
MAWLACERSKQASSATATAREHEGARVRETEHGGAAGNLLDRIARPLSTQNADVQAFLLVETLVERNIEIRVTAIEAEVRDQRDIGVCSLRRRRTEDGHRNEQNHPKFLHGLLL